MLDFNDTKTAFILKTDSQLKKAFWLFRLVANKSLVGLGKKASNLALRIGFPIRGIVKQTVYDQFVGGETIEECQKIIENLYQHGVSSLLDFAIEGKTSEADFDACRDEIIQTITYATEQVAIPFAVFKITGVASFALLEKRSAKIPFTETERRDWETAYQRVEQICLTADSFGQRIMIDAEESWIQNAIDELATTMMQRFNKDKIVVINTLQMYRHDRLSFLKEAYERSRQENYFLGIKLVRGAYMEKERDRASENNYLDPICATKKDSDINYDAAMNFSMEHIEHMLLVVGSHNETSARLLTGLIKEGGLDVNDKRIWFSQLYGMSDNLSFNLAKAGFNVVKYLPFGPVHETLPYLIRRAEENSSASGQSGRELSLIQKELDRRRLGKN